MQCPNCHQDAVDGAVFCNHCGIRLPTLCPRCHAQNPPESRFCHQCGNSLPATDSSTAPPHTATRETRISDIGSDLKILGRDLAAYSVPRIKSGCVSTARIAKRVGLFAGRKAKASAHSTAPRIRSLARRFKPDQPEPPALPTAPANHFAQPVATQEPQPAPWAPFGPAITCPRCHQVSEPGSLFCFSCGLPLDDAPTTSPAPGTVGQPAGFWIRFVAWLIDFIILAIVQGILIAIWPGLSEYLTSDSFGHPVDLLIFAVYALYFTLGVAIWSTTIGKRAMGLYVLRPSGLKAGFGRALSRHFASILSFLIFCIGYLLVGLRGDKRGLHDLICDTVVVRK